MQVEPPERVQRFLDGQTGQLVTEGHPAVGSHEHARGKALLDGVQRFGCQCFEKPGLGLRRH